MATLEQLGPYRIGRKLGRGGMGTVYEGVNPATGETAAVKVLSVHLAQAEGFRERFEAEIETLKKLRHPNIVRMFGYGEDEETLFYSMELVNGQSLEEAIRAGRRFDWREAIQIGVKLCRALKHAHDHGVIHRDIKPANILISGDGEVKLSDFGIAKLFGASGMTSTGGVLGTAEYMAPEQVDGGPISHRADLYSLGGVLYAMLARRPPFVAQSLAQMLNMQRFAEPEPLRRYAPDVPEELEQIIMPLLAKDSDKRVRSAMILSRQLEATEHGLLARQQRAAARTLEGDAEQDELGVGTTADEEIPPAGADGLAQPATNGTLRPGSSNGHDSQASTSAASMADPPASSSAAPPRIPRFTTVEEDEARERGRLITYRYSDGRVFSLQTTALVATLLLLGAAGWYFSRPPDKETLYKKVAAAAAKNSSEKLAEVEDEVKDFLKYYPNDRRSREMEDYVTEISLYRAERDLIRRGRWGDREKPLTAIERIWVEAMNDAEKDPHKAATKLKALLDVYSIDDANDERTRVCLELASRQLEQLQREAGRAIAQEEAELSRRLQKADALWQSSQQADRESADRIYRGIVELYGEKTWAEEQVKRARAALRRPGKVPASTPSPGTEKKDADKEANRSDAPTTEG